MRRSLIFLFFFSPAGFLFEMKRELWGKKVKFLFLTTIVSLIAKIRGKWEKDFRFSYIFIGTRTAPIGTWPLSSPPSSPSPRSSLESRRNSSRVLIRRLFGFARIEFPRFILSQMDRWMDEYHPVLWFLSIDEKKILEEKNIVGNFVFSGFLLEMKIVEGEESKISYLWSRRTRKWEKDFRFSLSIDEIDTWSWHNFHARRKKTILSITRFFSLFFQLYFLLKSGLEIGRHIAISEQSLKTEGNNDWTQQPVE